MRPDRHPGTIDGPNGSAIFIHIPRTGGHSVHQALGGKSSHLRAVHHRQMLGNRYNECFVFAIIRNPWDHAVSWYLNKGGKAVEGFRQWVRAGCLGCGVKYRGHNCGNGLDQASFIDGGAVELFLFPDVTAAVHAACRALGRPLVEPTVVNKTKRSQGYTHYYDRDTEEIIRRMRHREIRLMHGMAFGE